MAYQAFRTNGFPTYYDEDPTPWQADILESGLVFAFIIVAASFYVILPGIRGKEKLYTFIRVTLSLFIGAVIICTNFSYTWETGKIHTRTKYKAGTGLEISADIGVHIGLRGINITLKGTPESQLNETINYNEHFSWEWEQGRIGFGPFSGRFQQEYREAQFRGLPLPILWIAEYFTFDGEGIRWGRHYRQAGWFSHIMLWLSFPLWILTNIMFFILLRYGTYFLALTGMCMVISNILWASIRNFNDLVIPWEEGKMEFAFGGSFWVCLITGILCMLAALVIRFLDLRFPAQLTSFFGVDVLQDADEVLPSDDDPYSNNKNVMRRRAGGADADRDLEMKAVDGGENGGAGPIRPPRDDDDDQSDPDVPAATAGPSDLDDEELYEPAAPAPSASRYMKRKSRGLTQRFQKSRRRRPPPPPPRVDEGGEDGEELYVNEAYGSGPEEVKVEF